MDDIGLNNVGSGSSWVAVTVFMIILLTTLLIFVSGTSAQSSQPTIDIMINDSENGEDAETVDIIVSSEDGQSPTADWLTNDGVVTTAAQFRAFDGNNDGELADDEVRSAVSNYVRDGDLQDSSGNALGLSDNDIRQVVSDYVRNS